jgi:hypothetical protein
MNRSLQRQDSHYNRTVIDSFVCDHQKRRGRASIERQRMIRPASRLPRDLVEDERTIVTQEKPA